jgi:hypothetical protein
MHTTYTVNDLMNRLCGSRIRDRERGRERGKQRGKHREDMDKETGIKRQG